MIRPMSTILLGINANVHDSAAAVLVDGSLAAAAREERFTGKKHASDFPSHAIQYCLDAVGCDSGLLAGIAYYWKPWKGLAHRAVTMMRALPHSLAFLYPTKAVRGTPATLVRHVLAPYSFARRFGLPRGFHFVEHEWSHACSSFLTSTFDSAVIISLDLSGETASTFVAVGEGNHIHPLWTINYPHSLGSFYATVTQFLGFSPNADEYRVMGLAAYGKPTYYQQMQQLVTLLPNGQFRLDLSALVYHWGQERFFSDKFIRLFGPQRSGGDPLGDSRYADIARSAQLVLEDACLHIAREAAHRTGLRNLCLAGGVALNGAMVKRLREETPFEHIHIPPSPDDAGTAVGSALYLWHVLAGNHVRGTSGAFTGPAFSDSAIREALDEARLSSSRCSNPESLAAVAIASGQVVGWFQGRMEFGPRALGNRSILADPRDPSMKERINEKVKRRELFRPFAASVLEERANEYFQLGQSAPYMIELCNVRPEKRSVLPAITHVDGTSRPQTVNCRDNERFWRLLTEFEKRTGVPMVLNTSFNLAGDPIVCSPVQAVRTFLSSGIDVLFLGDYVVRKAGQK